MSRGTDALADYIRRTAVSRPVADAVIRKTAIDQTARAALAHATASGGIVSNYEDVPVNDGIPPQPPQNLVIEPYIKALAVDWDSPLPADAVMKAEVSYTPAGGAERIVPAGGIYGHTVGGLFGGTAYTVKARFVDAWGLMSPWSAPASGTPLQSVAESLADDGVAPAPPSGITLSAYPKGFSAQWNAPVAGDWIDHSNIEVTPQGGVAALYPGGVVAASVTGLTSSTPVTVRVQLVDKWGRTSAWTAAGSVTPEPSVLAGVDMTDGVIAAQKIADLAVTSAKIALLAVDTARMADLSVTTAKIADLAVSTAKIADANITSAKIALLAVGTAHIQDASIVSAKVAQLVADKITGGTISTTTINIASALNLTGAGRLYAGRTILGSLGLTLPTMAAFTNPAVDADAKVTNSEQFASMNFYNEADFPPNLHRGVSFRADGNGTTYRGNIVLHAFRSSAETNQFAASNAALEVRSQHANQSARVFASPFLELAGGMQVGGNMTLNGRRMPRYELQPVSIAAGVTMIVSFADLLYIGEAHAYVATGGGNWRHLPSAPLRGGIDVWYEVSGTQLKVHNDSSVSLSVYGMVH